MTADRVGTGMALDRRTLLRLGAGLGLGGLAGCTSRLPIPGTGSPAAVELLTADVPRTDPDVPGERLDPLADAIAGFGFELLRELAAGGAGGSTAGSNGDSTDGDPDDTAAAGNLVVSPYSIETALAMCYAGARGDTAREIASTLLLPTDPHPAVNALDRRIDPPDGAGSADGTATPTPDGDGDGGGDGDGDADADGDDDRRPFTVETASSLWGQRGFAYAEPFLETLARHYGAGLRAVDFREDPEGARRAVNGWVTEETDGVITDLLPRGSIDPNVRFVIANAVYFLGDWRHQFQRERTERGEFTALDGSTSRVPLMRQSAPFPYAAVAPPGGESDSTGSDGGEDADGDVDRVQVIELPYVNADFGMVIALPPAGAFEAVQSSLTASRFREWTAALSERTGRLALPTFSFETGAALRPTLSALGMPRPFDPDRADFGAMVEGEGTPGLFLFDVYHRARVTVDEEGTEAAAATGAVGGTTSAPVDPFEMVVDRPFVFAIRHRPTNAPLFVGRVVDAGAAQ
jgi:serpin B